MPAAPAYLNPVPLPAPVPGKIGETAELYLDTLKLCNARHVEARRWYGKIRQTLKKETGRQSGWPGLFAKSGSTAWPSRIIGDRRK